MKNLLRFLTVGAMLLPALVSSSQAQTIVLTSMITGVNRPVWCGPAGDGSNRLFILEKRTGKILIWKKTGPLTGSLLGTPYLDVSALISTSSSAGSERGLLGIAFHPQFSTNRRFFVYYTVVTSGDLRIAEYRQNASNPDVADTATTTIITIAHPTNTNHNGGCMAFGPDGYLYAGTGDGGGAGDTSNNAQNTSVLLGKMLRLDVDSTTSTPYGVPATNPFVGVAGADEIYAYGLRNPWRFSFDSRPGGSNRLFVADVGQGTVEEVDIVGLGNNMGWRIMEGNACYNPSVGCSSAGLTMPIATYTHSESPGHCSITGGYVYRGTKYPLLNGKYIFADYCSGVIFMLTETSPGVFSRSTLLDTPYLISSFGQDEDGQLYVCQYTDSDVTNSTIYRLTETSAVSDYEIY
ncbi:MAG: PQQ-dependent sugar dehydrogenase [Candidatus Sumerlaeaceae bacterium]|nr:PQQ-dependent sugar dehydrogenase [Candidatus Sumerlaeaceae bacterium]